MSSNSPPSLPGNSEDSDPVGRPGPPNPVDRMESLGARLRDLDVDTIRRYLAAKLGFHDVPDPTEGPVEKVLDEVSLDGVVRWIQSDRCKNIITLAGAGISTSKRRQLLDKGLPQGSQQRSVPRLPRPSPGRRSTEWEACLHYVFQCVVATRELYCPNGHLFYELSAGIPDFRSPETGLYHNLQKYDLPEPQAIFEINFFRQNPKPFFTLAKELFPGKFKPTLSHYFIRLLHEKGLLLRHYTQNIDTLERGAGLPEDKLVEAHGTFYTSHCIECRKQYSLEFIKEHIFSEQIPICTVCPGVVKPDIVFFGESLPERFQQCVQQDFQHCDMLIIMGSSLEVQPFASLIDMVPDWCPRLLINREKAGTRSPLMQLWGLMSGGLQLDEDSIRDVARLGNCDDGCQDLADRLGWGDELRALVSREHVRLEQEGALSAPHAPVPAGPSAHVQ